jgi:hypothetical protein
MATAHRGRKRRSGSQAVKDGHGIAGRKSTSAMAGSAGTAGKSGFWANPWSGSWLKTAIIVVFLAAVAYFFGATIYGNWQGIRSYHFEFNLLLLLVSFVIIYIPVVMLGIYWNIILGQLSGKPIAPSRAVYIQFAAWMARYIPGKLGLLLVKIELGSREGASRRHLFFASMYENIFSTLSSFIIGIPILLYYFLGFFSNNLYSELLPLALAFIACALVFLHPSVFRYFVNMGLRLFRRRELPRNEILGWGQIAANLLRYVTINLFYGIGFYVMVDSFTPIGISKLLPMVGILVFSTVIGLLAVFAPAGLGVREGIMLLLLQSYFPLEIATVITVFARIWVSIADLAVFASIPFVRAIADGKAASRA